MARVAEFIVDSLRAAGVRRIYGVVGDSLNGLTEAIRQRKELEWIGVTEPWTPEHVHGLDRELALDEVDLHVPA